MRNHKHQLWKRESFLNGFYFSLYWFNLESLSIPSATIHRAETRRKDATACILYSALGATAHYPLYAEVTFSLCNRVINGNKETAEMTGMQTGTPAFVHLWETTAWQSTLIFMREFFWINEQPLCSLSEVFLIIWTLFSLHATLYQKFIKTFFFSPFTFLMLGHWYSPRRVCIYLCRLP